MYHTPQECFRAARACDDVLAALAAYDMRDDAIERLELAIMDDRVEALLYVRESTDIGRGNEASSSSQRMHADPSQGSQSVSLR